MPVQVLKRLPVNHLVKGLQTNLRNYLDGTVPPL